MAQLPVSMQRRRAAVTSIHDKPPSFKQKLSNMGGWLLFIVALVILVVGMFGLYKLITDARTAQLHVVGMGSATEKQQLIQHIEPIVKDNYFTSDLEQIRDKALEIPWIEHVVVSRVWPNNIRVRVLPRHPVARWGTGRLLSDGGYIFTEAQPKNHANLPILHGPASQSKTMMRRYNEINQLFRPVGLRLKELYLTERMTWFMQFDSGLRVIVDQGQTMSKLQRLSHLAQTDLKPVWSNISAVDLRYRNGLSLQWSNVAPPKIVNGHFVVTNNDANVAVGSIATQ